MPSRSTELGESRRSGESTQASRPGQRRKAASLLVDLHQAAAV